MAVMQVVLPPVHAVRPGLGPTLVGSQSLFTRCTCAITTLSGGSATVGWLSGGSNWGFGMSGRSLHRNLVRRGPGLSL